MATTSKLEMSLDDIIKSNKSKEAKERGLKRMIPIGGRGGKVIGGKRAIGTVKGRQIGRNRIGQQQIKGKFGGGPKRIGGPLRRRPIGIVNRVGGGGGIATRKNLVRNKAVISATKNLVQKLVKKALTLTNVGPILSASRGKIQRIQIGRIQRRPRTIVLNKISARSRVIGRRPRIIVAQQQQQPVIVQQRVRGRGPVRFATAPVMQTVSRRNIVPKRRFNTVRYVQQQQQPTVIVQQQPKQQQTSQAMSVRAHINALRRASTLQQLQSQFLSQQQQAPRQQQQQFVMVRQQQQPQQQVVRQPRTIIIPQLQPRRPRQQQPQQIIIHQQQQQPQRRRRPQQQQPMQQQFVVRQQFAGGRRPRQQRQQQQILQLDPLYEPPNFLQRIPAANSNAFLPY